MAKGIDKRRLKWQEFSQNVLKNRVNCTSKCPYFSRCPMAQYRNTSSGKPCAVAGLSDEDQRRYLAIFVFEDDALKDEAKRMLWKLGSILNLEDDPKEIEKYLELILRFVRTFKAELKEEAGDNEPITINIEGLSAEVSEDPNKKLFIAPDIVVQTDPESLLNSPIVDKIAAPKADRLNQPIFVKK